MPVRRESARSGRLLVEVTGLSGKTYPAGTNVRIVGGGGAVDAWAGSEWVPLRWWEFIENADPVSGRAWESPGLDP